MSEGLSPLGKVLAAFEGCVLTVERTSFTVELIEDGTDEGSIAEIWLTQVPEDERHKLMPGRIFRWEIYIGRLGFVCTRLTFPEI